MMSIKKKIITNTAISGIVKVLTTIIGFFFIPVMIKNIGTLDFGLLAYLQTFTIIGFLSLAGIGLGPAIIKYVSELTVINSKEEILKIINTAFICLLIIGVFIALLGFSFLEKILGHLNLPHEQLDSFREGFKYILFTIVIILPLSVFGNVLEGLQKYKIVKSLEGLFWVTYMIGGMYLSVHNVSFEIIFKFFLNLQLIHYFLTYVFVHYYFKNNIISVRFFEFLWLKKMFQMGKFLSLMSIVGTLTKSLEKLFIGIYLSPIFISYYEIIIKIPSVIKNVFSWLDAVIIPVTSEISKKEKFSSIKKLFEISINIKIIFLYPLIVMVFFFVEDNLKVWISNEYVFLARYIQLLLIWNMIMPFSNHGTKYLIGLNKLLNYLMAYNFISNGLKLLIIIILIKNYGLLSIILGYITLIFPTPYMFNKICKLLNVNKWKIYKNIIKTIVVSNIIIVTPYLINLNYEIPITLLFGCLSIYFLISYYINAKLIFNLNIFKYREYFLEIRVR